MYDRPLTIEQVLTMLAETPLRIASLTEGLTPAQLLTPPEPGEWSARDVLAHLRACADMWGKYIVVILSEDRPTFKAVNPTTWIKKTDYREQEFQALAAGFYIPTCRSAGSVEAVGTRSLVPYGDGDGGGKATRTDRIYVCPVAGKP